MQPYFDFVKHFVMSELILKWSASNMYHFHFNLMKVTKKSSKEVSSVFHFLLNMKLKLNIILKIQLYIYMLQMQRTALMYCASNG